MRITVSGTTYYACLHPAPEELRLPAARPQKKGYGLQFSFDDLNGTQVEELANHLDCVGERRLTDGEPEGRAILKDLERLNLVLEAEMFGLTQRN